VASCFGGRKLIVAEIAGGSDFTSPFLIRLEKATNNTPAKSTAPITGTINNINN
jgi:hypothetical protein